MLLDLMQQDERRVIMKQFVFWTGVYNILLGLGFFLPPLISFLRVPVPESGVWVQLPATIVVYLGVLLILCSRNLRSRASIVCWEGILRIAAFFLLASYGFFGGAWDFYGICGDS